MRSEINLDLVQTTFMKLAERNSISINELKNSSKEEGDWSLSYKQSLQQEVAADIQDMLDCFDLHRLAIEKNDLITAKSALVMAAGFARTLQGTFRNIHDECYKVLHHDSRFTWPSIPEDYKIPDHYNYKGPR